MTTATTKSQNRITILLAVLILIPSGYGFVGKFIELVHVYQGDASGAFAVAPIVNYLLASLGFFACYSGPRAAACSATLNGPNAKCWLAKRCSTARISFHLSCPRIQ